MPDIVDTASEVIEVTTSAAITLVRQAHFEQGGPGECDLCGYEKSRVVPRAYEGLPINACGGCRDTYRLDK